jgi:cephalosporin hydroxylase
VSFDISFDELRQKQYEKQLLDVEFKEITAKWLRKSVENRYSYGFNWLGIPIIQLPTDLVAFQEIVFNTKPTLIIECGVARGGSIVFWASMQQLVGTKTRVIGIDIEIRQHARRAIQESNFKNEILLIEGDSTDHCTYSEVKNLIRTEDKVMVVLDSNHSHEHVLSELELYAPLVSLDCFLLVLDTVIEDLPLDSGRPWGPGSSPKTAVFEYMKHHKEFSNMQDIENRIAITVAPQGYWKRVEI